RLRLRPHGVVPLPRMSRDPFPSYAARPRRYNFVPMEDNGLVDYYSRRAPEYERIYARPERQPDLRALEARVLGDLEGHAVLEIACGTGWCTDRIATVARSMVATDASEK